MRILKKLLFSLACLSISNFVFADTTISDIDELSSALNTGGSYIIDSDLDLTSSSRLTSTSEVVIDGNSYKIENAQSGAILVGANSDFSISNVVFSNNTATYGAAIYNEFDSSEILYVSGSFEYNTAYHGGAIYNAGYIDTIEASFTGNVSTDGYGGAIYNKSTETCTIKSIVGDFTGNTQAIFNGNGAVIESVTGSFYNDTSYAIYNSNNAKITLNATAGDIVFDGNAYAMYNNGTVTLNGYSSSITINDKITGNSSGVIYTTSNNDGYVEINNSVSHNEIYVLTGTLKLSSTETSTASVSSKIYVSEDATLISNISYIANDVLINGYAKITADTTSDSQCNLSGVGTLEVDGVLYLSMGFDGEGYGLHITNLLLNVYSADDYSSIIFSDYQWSSIIESYATNIELKLNYNPLENDEFNLITGDINNFSYDNLIIYDMYGNVLSSDLYDVSMGYSSLTVQFLATVPEPSSYAIIFGACAIALVIYRRRK